MTATAHTGHDSLDKLVDDVAAARSPAVVRNLALDYLVEHGETSAAFDDTMRVLTTAGYERVAAVIRQARKEKQP